MAPFRERRVRFFGAWIDLLSMEETLERVDSIIRERTMTQHVAINVAKLVMMQQDKSLRDVINACGLISADGQGIVWGARLLGLKIPERVSGIDLFERIVEHSATRGYRLYFLGAKQEIVEAVVRKFQARYPVQIAGYRNGYFRSAQEPEIAQAIRDSKADVLFVGMSSPQKEWFLSRYASCMSVPFVMGVGGSFDVIAGSIKRAPVWMQRLGLEWFFRLLCEPRRMWKRYLVTNTVFLGMLIGALVRKGQAAHKVAPG